VITLVISDILVAGQYTQSDDSNAYDYYDDFVDSSTTVEPSTDAPTTISSTTTTTRRTTTRPSTVVYYTKPNRFINYNKYQTTDSASSVQRPRPQPSPRTTTPSPAGINRNAVDLDRSENRKDYAQSRIAEETEDEKYLSRRYARFLFNQRTG
jgi:hypothetical protein